MTTIFSPRQTMLRVDQKNFPAWALFDAGLDSPGLLTLYVVIWYSSYMGWVPTQADLAAMGKMGLRTVQDNLKLLEQRGFVATRRENGRKFYDLALSHHVLSEFLRQGVEFQAADQRHALQTREVCAPDASDASDTRNPRMGHAESAHPFKNIKEIKGMKNTPLSPLPHGLAPQAVAGSRTAERGRGESFPLESSNSLPEASFPSGRDQVKRAASGRSSRPESPFPNPDFERLWAIWPNHQAKLPAQRVFASLNRRGLLPSLEILLQAVRRFQAEDCGWKQGARYVPRLDYWLRDERWTDEPRVTGPASVGADSCNKPEHIAPLESPSGVVQIQASRAALNREKQEKASLSAETARRLASISPVFRRIADKLHMTEAAHDQTRTGTDRIFGLSGRNTNYGESRHDSRHDPRGTAQARENHHNVQTVVAIPDGTGRAQTDAPPGLSIGDVLFHSAFNAARSAGEVFYSSFSCHAALGADAPG